ncbi:MAG: YdbL family protein [Oceanobacter sp.]
MKKGLLVLMMLLGAASSWSLELDEARELGLVGERSNGYIGAVVSGNAEVDALVKDTNSQRKTHYRRIANDQNTPLENIEKIAGEKLVAKAMAEDFFYQTSSGVWLK